MQLILAQGALVYIIACVFYYIRTRSFGTPFMDAVNQNAELKQIKEESSKKRKTVFMHGMLIGLAYVFIVRRGMI